MNIQLTEGASQTNGFIESCEVAGLKAIRLFIPESAEGIAEVAACLKKCKISVYLILYKSDQTGPNDTLYNQFKSSPDEIVARYKSVLKIFKDVDVIGVGFPEGLHLFTRTTAAATFGLRRTEMIPTLNKISAEIRSAGRKVVFPMRVDDVQGEVWKAVDFDVFDVETMISSKVLDALDLDAVRDNLDSHANKPYWFGRTGILGGYIMPAMQAKFLRKIQGYAKNSEYAFLWSERASDKFQWSVDGKFIVDVLSASLPARAGGSGTPAIANWKAQQRRNVTIPEALKDKEPIKDHSEEDVLGAPAPRDQTKATRRKNRVKMSVSATE